MPSLRIWLMSEAGGRRSRKLKWVVGWFVESVLSGYLIAEIGLWAFLLHDKVRMILFSLQLSVVPLAGNVGWCYCDEGLSQLLLTM